MDKKMLKKVLGYVAVAMGVLAFLMIFLKAGGLDGEGYTGFEIAFGVEEMGVQVLGFNFLAFLAYLLPLAGGVVALFAMLKNNSLLYWIAAGLFVAGAILVCLLPTYWYTAGHEMMKDMMKAMDIEVMIGGVLAVIFSVLGAVACVLKNVLKD